MNGFRAKRSSRLTVKCVSEMQDAIGKRTREQVAKHMRPASKKSFWRKLDYGPYQTDTGGQGEYPKVSERTVAKELGKNTP